MPAATGVKREDGHAGASRDPGGALRAATTLCDGGCCTPTCANIRRYNACPLPSNLRPCASVLGHVWVCVGQCPNGIHYANQCWSPTNTVIPIDQKPPHDVLVENPVCSPGCNDPKIPCTECQLYYRVGNCPGSTPPDPPLYVPVERVHGCMFLRFGGCWFVSDSSTPVQLPSNGVVYTDQTPLYPGGTCCDGCFPDCRNVGGADLIDCVTGRHRISPICCCSATYTDTMFLRYQQVTTLGQVDEDRSVITSTASGSGSRSFINGQPTGGSPQIRSLTVQVYPDGHSIVRGDGVTDFPGWFCGTDVQWWDGFQAGDPYLQCPEGTFSYTTPEPDGGLVVATVSVRLTCTGYTATGRWVHTTPRQNAPRTVLTETITHTISQQGGCGGGCGQGGLLLLGGPPAPVVPVPLSEWPPWAWGFRLAKRRGDAGVGDTVQRLIGDENSEKFKRWYKGKFGKDCGCAGRRILWNQLYRYT